MKKLLIITLFISYNISAQKMDEIFSPNFVECCYSEKTTDSIYIYEKPNGKVIKILNPLNQVNCWYKFAISESKDGWLKIENILILPSCKDNDLNKDITKHKGKWILAKNMIINLPNSKPESGLKYNFYENPNINSEIVFTAKEFMETELIGVYQTWAKVKFTHKNKTLYGWLEKKHQCPYLWTTCPVYE